MALAAVMLPPTSSPAKDAGTPPPPAPARQPSVFQKTDTDGDGNIAAAEFQAHRDARFKDMDANSDGVVVTEEYAAFFCGANARADKEAKPARTEETTLFETMDANDNGFVTAPECVVYRIVIFRQLDANGDGKLTPEEFAAGASKRFTAMDADKDNTVAKEEFDAVGVNKERGSRASETNLPVAR